ncbi:oxygenase MpaB family protein [Granulicoccus phenolivorans]|uniref:oxygenase MpaB family protein n=1 Tax=Granulicoccus phenolivorans TaxID=266854 RepID=UPI000422BE48|nr:oxygenase MpaB family protein [Granulicoccus phenolivorans]
MKGLNPVSRARRALGRTLRSRVAGADADARAQVIWGSAGPRWFTRADPIWRVHEDSAMFSGGIAALLLQMLHPMAMAGVAGHSGYRSDPWGRLQRTSNYLASTTYGTIEHAEATIAHVAAIHRRVRGKDAHGRPYGADDPHLLTWVHVAEIHSFLAAFQAYARRPLTPAEADTYVAQAGVAAGRLGVPAPPQSVTELRTVLESYRPELELTPAAADAAAFLLHDPPLPWPARPGYWALAAGGVGVLPDWARHLLGLDHPAGHLLARPLGRGATATVRWAMSPTSRSRPRPLSAAG